MVDANGKAVKQADGMSMVVYNTEEDCMGGSASAAPAIKDDELSDDEKQEVKMIASHIYFELNSDKLKSESLSDLDKLAKILSLHKKVKMSIEGHTDNSGDHDYNVSLSQKRAEAVKTYLEGKGISASRLAAKGYGEDKPVADNSTKEGRAKNRRVELIVSAMM